MATISITVEFVKESQLDDATRRRIQMNAVAFKRAIGRKMHEACAKKEKASG